MTRYRGISCLNCGHPLDVSDKYCPNCGQLNSTKKLSFKDFFKEFFENFFAYDSRFRRTLSAMMFHPGRISKDYIQGKRERYANPFRFYISVSIIFFIIWGFSNNIGDFGNINNAISKDVQELSPEELEELRAELKNVPSIENAPLSVDSLLLKQQENSGKTYKDFYFSQEKLDSLPFSTAFQKQLFLYDRFHKETTIINPIIALDSLQHSTSTFNRWTYKKVADMNTILKNPEIFVGYFINKLPLIIFFYLPVFALFIWLLYWRRPFNYMEHLVFTFHVQTIFFVLMGISLIISNIFNWDSVFGILILFFLFYLYKALKNFYGQGKFKTLVKFVILNGIFLILAVIASIISLIASFAIY
ncbi:MAG: DUF3667 domain-containing protein [Gillisia sp.]|nr:DUF3667 domain-containing protein [Gillisia sp.]